MVKIKRTMIWDKNNLNPKRGTFFKNNALKREYGKKHRGF